MTFHVITILYNKYSKELIPLPIPKLIVFYNGLDEKEDMILKLSDAFSPQANFNSDVEVSVRMININYGKNKELMNACEILEGYSWFVNAVREAKTKDVTVKEAVDKVLNNMPDKYSIKSLLTKNRAEVCEMLLKEYTEQEARNLTLREGAIEQIFKLVFKGKLSKQEGQEELEMSPDIFNTLFEQYKLNH